MHVPSHTPQNAPRRASSEGNKSGRAPKTPPPSFSRNLLETWKLREQIFSLPFPPSCPPPRDPGAGAGEPDSQRAPGRCDRRQPAAGRPRRDSPEPRPRRRRWPGRQGSLPVSRPPSPSQATSGRPALSPDSRLSTPPPPLPPQRNKRRVQPGHR